MGLLDKFKIETNSHDDQWLLELTHYTERNKNIDSHALESLLDRHRDNNKVPDMVYSLLERITQVIKSREEHYRLRLEMVTKVMKFGIWEMDILPGDPINPDNELRFSHEIRQMLGYNDETDFPNRFESWSQLLHPDDEEFILVKFIDHLLDYTGNTKFDEECRLRNIFGQYKWFRTVGVTTRDQIGKPIILVGAFFDIDERKQNEEENRQLAERYKLIHRVFEEAPWELNIVWPNPLQPSNEAWWSEQFRAVLGYDNVYDFPNLLSSWLESLHPEDYNRTLEAISSHLNDRTGTVEYDVNFRLKKKSGDYRLFHVRAQTERNEQGIPTKIAGTIRDITRDVSKENVMKLIQLRMEDLLEDIRHI